MSDSLMHALSRLQMAEPDAARGERTRQRCRARLQGARAPLRHVGPGASRVGGVWRPALAAIGATYLVEVVAHAVRVYGLK